MAETTQDLREPVRRRDAEAATTGTGDGLGCGGTAPPGREHLDGLSEAGRVDAGVELAYPVADQTHGAIVGAARPSGAMPGDR